MVAVELTSDDRGTEGAGGVHTATRPDGAEEVACKESKADGDGSHESSTVLLDGHHENGENKDRGEEHLDQESLGNVDTGLQGCSDLLDTVGRGQSEDETGACNTAKDLSDKENDSTARSEYAREPERNGDGRVEKTTRDSVEHPSGDQERQTERRRDEHDCLVTQRRCCLRLRRRHRELSGLGTSLCEEEEHGGADEFTETSHEVGLESRELGLAEVATAVSALAMVIVVSVMVEGDEPGSARVGRVSGQAAALLGTAFFDGRHLEAGVEALRGSV